MTVRPFFRIRNQDASLDRQLQQIQQVLASLGGQAAAAVTVTGPSPTTILAVKTGQVWALVSGRATTNTIQSFVDAVLYDPLHGTTITTLSSTSTGTSAANGRTYSLSSGMLQLVMAAGTYKVTVFPSVLS